MGIIPLLSEWGANQSAISELILSCCITVIHQMEYDDNWVWINKISLQIFKNIVTGSCYKKNMLESHEQLLEATTKIFIVLLV